MEGRGTRTLIDEFIRSVHVFVAAVDGGTNRRWRSGNRLAPRPFMILEMLHATGVHNVGEVARFLGVTDAGAGRRRLFEDEEIFEEIEGILAYA